MIFFIFNFDNRLIHSNKIQLILINANLLCCITYIFCYFVRLRQHKYSDDFVNVLNILSLILDNAYFILNYNIVIDIL